MYSLMALQVVIPVEGLGTLVALEGALGLWRWTAWVVDVKGMRMMRRQPRMMAVA
jgi:hypothetical protein